MERGIQVRFVVFTALLLFIVTPVPAQTFITSDTTINTDVVGSVDVGIDALGHIYVPGPTLDLLDHGVIEANLALYGVSTANLYGGHVNGDLTTLGPCLVNIDDGVIAGSLLADQGTVINIAKGHLGALSLHDNSQAYMEAGTGGSVNVTYDSEFTIRDGSVYNIDLHSHGIANIIGGDILGGIDSVYLNSLNMSGGHVAGPVSVSEGSKFDWSGGSIAGAIWAEDASTIRIFGHGLTKTPIAVDPWFGGTYLLSGWLMDGTDITGKTVNLSSTIGRGYLELHNVPEPGAFQAFLCGLLPLGAMRLRGRRMRQ